MGIHRHSSDYLKRHTCLREEQQHTFKIFGEKVHALFEKEIYVTLLSGFGHELFEALHSGPEAGAVDRD